VECAKAAEQVGGFEILGDGWRMCQSSTSFRQRFLLDVLFALLLCCLLKK